MDFRSDTVTRPTAAMLEAMCAAPLGDSVYGDDPTENAFEGFMQELTGKPAGLLVVTGVMSNQIALRVHTHWASQKAMFGAVLFAANSHLGFRELGGPVYHSRVVPIAVPFDGPYMRASDVRAFLHSAHDLHSVTTVGLCVENTMAGQVMPLEELRAMRALADEHGLFLHLDGARLWNASVATGVAIRDWAACVDSVSLCFSKGLGAPMGSMLLGSRELVALGREVRKSLGGGWRQSGLVAAACRYAVEHNVARLADDHANARVLAQRLQALGMAVTLPDTKYGGAFLPCTATLTPDWAVLSSSTLRPWACSGIATSSRR